MSATAGFETSLTLPLTCRSPSDHSKVQDPLALLGSERRLTRELEALDDARPNLLRIVGVFEHVRVRRGAFNPESRGTAPDSDYELVILNGVSLLTGI